MAQRRVAQSLRTAATRSHVGPPPPVAGPRIVTFLNEDDTAYFVGEPGGNRRAQVPKRRARADPYARSQGKGRQGSSERLVRWSSFALVGVVCGGIVGAALGGIVALAALVGLARLSRRVRRWQLHARKSDTGMLQLLPVQATQERMQLLAALGQAFGAILLGSAVLFILLALR